MNEEYIDEIARQYAEVCDVIERSHTHIPLSDDPDRMLLTSSHARKGATIIFEALGIDLKSVVEELKSRGYGSSEHVNGAIVVEENK